MSVLPLVYYLLTSDAAPQGITNDGNCNANIHGSGNNVTIECPSGTTKSASKIVRVVVSKNQIPIIQGNFSWQFVDTSRSDFTLEIDDDQILYFDLDEGFEDESLKLDRGEHFYTMEVSLTFFNGFSDSVSCSGVIDAQTSASIVPRLLIAQNPQSGKLFANNCGFTLR